MDENKTLIIDFWYEFDKSFLSNPDLLKAKEMLNPYVKLKDSFLSHHRKNTVQTGFKKEHEDIKNSINLLADNHIRIIE